MVFGGNKPRINLETALSDGEVVKSALEIDAPHLHDPKPPPLRAVVDRQLLKQHHAMGNRVQLQIVLLRGEVVEQHYGGLTARKEVLQREDLTTIPKRALCQQAKLRQAIKDDPRGGQGLNPVEDHLGCFAELHLGRMQDSELLARIQAALRRDQFKDRDAFERPAMALGHQPQFALGLRQRDVEGRFAAANSLQQEFQGQRGLARTGLSFEQIHPLRVDTAPEDVIQAGISCRDLRKLLVIESLRIVNHIQSLFSQTKGCEGNYLSRRAFPDQAVDFAGRLIAFACCLFHSGNQ
jgi:hypothetical protein